MIVNYKFTIAPFTSPLQEGVLRILSQGPIEGKDLLIKTSATFPVTKQGLYKALRKLLYDEMVIKEGTFFSLNKVWLSRLSDFIEEGEKNLGTSLPLQSSRPNGRKVKIFKNADALDIYWGHLFLTLKEKFKDDPFFFFNHHSWFIHERPHSETYLYETSLKTEQKILITLGVNTVMAQKFKKSFMKNNIQIVIDEEMPIPKTDHICIIRDYFIVTRYDNRTMGQIDSLFNHATSFGEKETKELQKILSNCKKPKIIITKNKTKANAWKRRFAKNFVIKNPNYRFG